MERWIWLGVLSFMVRLLAIPPSAPADESPTTQPGPNVPSKNRPLKEKLDRWSLDILVIGNATTTVLLTRENIREAIRTSGSFGNIADNFGNPISSVREGTREDRDPFVINYVAHPLSYAGMGLYLKERGYRDWSALLFTQIHNITWEFAVEGSAFPPSGKDLLSDLSGALVGIFLLDRVSRYGEKKLEAPDKKFYHHFFYWMNPFNVLDDKLLKKGKVALVLKVE